VDAAPEPEPEPPAVEITPYGLLATSFHWASAPMVNLDAPIAVAPGSGAALGATARQSRLGLRAVSAPLADEVSANAASVVAEIDFFGGWYADNDITYAMSHPRLRLLFARLEWSALTVTAGQDWIVFSPLNPVSIVHVAVAGFQGAGNAWGRLPQAKAEVRTGGLSAEAAVLAPVSGGPIDDTTEAGLVVGRNPGRADRSETPSLEARVAYAIPIDDRKLRAGASVHWAREEVTVGDPAMPATETVASWGAALDFDLPVLPVLAVRGELLWGANLDGFFVNADVIGGEPVSVLGGWAQLSLTLDPVAIHGGAGVEDARAPDGQTLPDGATDENTAVYVAITGKAGPLTAGVELSHVWTKRVGAETARGTHIALGALVAF
jgi:hypothetical protein